VSQLDPSCWVRRREIRVKCNIRNKKARVYKKKRNKENERKGENSAFLHYLISLTIM